MNNNIIDISLHDLLISGNDVELLKNNIKFEKIFYSKKRLCLKEEDIQLLTVEYLENKGLFFHPSMSGIYTDSFKVRKRMKKQGVRKGYPDLYIIKNNGKDKILFLELKSLSGRLSDEQKNILRVMKSEGLCVSVSYGIYDAIYKIEKYLAGEPIIWNECVSVGEGEK